MTFGALAQEMQASDMPDGHLDPQILAQHCISWGVGPFTLNACVDLSVPEADVSVYLLGVKIAKVTLDPDHLCAHVGGSVDGFKAVVDACLALDPLRLIIDAEICIPLEGCKKYHHEILLSPGTGL